MFACLQVHLTDHKVYYSLYTVCMAVWQCISDVHKASHNSGASSKVLGFQRMGAMHVCDLCVFCIFFLPASTLDIQTEKYKQANLTCLDCGDGYWLTQYKGMCASYCSQKSDEICIGFH